MALNESVERDMGIISAGLCRRNITTGTGHRSLSTASPNFDPRTSGSFAPRRNYHLEMAPDTENRSLKRKLKTLETHMKRTEALATFLRKNPALAADCAIKATMYGGQVSLYFEERAYIHAVGSDPVQLRLTNASAWEKMFLGHWPLSGPQAAYTVPWGSGFISN